MQIAYYDETGDDGFPHYSSPLFVLSALYLHYLNWRPCFESTRDFRRHLMTAFRLPVKLEMHTRHFILNKNPYRTLGITDENRVRIKESKESYFIQLADLVSYIVYLHSLVETGAGAYPNRLSKIVDQPKVNGWMERLKPSLNLSASGRDRFGIVYHPS